MIFVYRWACTIADPVSESVILTGGVETLKTVSRYNVIILKEMMTLSTSPLQQRLLTYY